MSNQTTQVVVIGGSLAGLMCGIVLKSLGCAVHVLERSAPSVMQSQAAGIRAGPELHSFLEEYVPNLKDYAITADVVEIMNKQGQVVQNIPPKVPLRLTTWKAVYDMLKMTLLREIEDEPLAIYQTRQSVEDFHVVGETVTLTVLDLKMDTVWHIDADLVIAADGAHSKIRESLCPEIIPRYVGFLSWRGRIPEMALSEETRNALKRRCAVLRVDGGYQISYYVPTDGSLGTEDREFVWIWHDTRPEGSILIDEVLTDIDGHLHKTTVPKGKMRPGVWQRVLKHKSSMGNPYFIELMEKIEEPFVSVIREFSGSKAVFLEGKLLLAGDALALCRPNGGGSTSQAAFQAQQLARAWIKEITFEECERLCLESAAQAGQFSISMTRFFKDAQPPSVSKSFAERSIGKQ